MVHAKVLQKLGSHSNSREGMLSDKDECFILERAEDRADFGCVEIKTFLEQTIFPVNSTCQQRKEIRHKSVPFTMIGGLLYKSGKDMILCRAVNREEAQVILSKCHKGVCGGYFAGNTTVRKILTAGYFWPSMFKDSNGFCKTCPT